MQEVQYRVAREMEVPKRALNRRRGTHEGPETCVCANTILFLGVSHAGREGRINVLPWYRLVGVVSTSNETQGGKTGLPRKGKWPPTWYGEPTGPT